MALTLNETRVSNNQPFSEMLKNLQANILKGHGRNFAHHLFFQFDKTKIAEAKNWITQFANGKITSAKQQLEGTKQFHEGHTSDAGPVFTLSLSAAGYDTLGLGGSKPGGNGFNNGMEASAGPLGDDKSTWEESFKSPIHMLIIVADDSNLTAKSKSDDIATEVSPFAKLLLNQRGNVLKINGTGIEHFGYADGISQPLYMEKAINEQTSTKEWNDTTKLNLLLVPDTGTQEPDCFGSFLVFRKLEQNVKAFKDAEGDNSGTPGKLPLIKDVLGKDNPELAGAMIVGRFESGVPVIKSSIDNLSNPPIRTNDFNYSDDKDGLKCPAHSHVRLMNPRDGDTTAGDVSAQRITRRGIPFDDVNRIPENEIENISEEMLDKNQPEKGVGLLFMCYQSDIDRQFEILQAHWANEGNIKGHMIGSQDSIIGQGNNPNKTLPNQWGKPAQSNPFSFHSFVTMKGGEYFFTPSISFLKSLSIGTS